MSAANDLDALKSWIEAGTVSPDDKAEDASGKEACSGILGEVDVLPDAAMMEAGRPV